MVCLLPTLREKENSPSVKDRALRKPIFPECCTRGRKCTRGREAFPSATKCLALGEGHLPECNTQGKVALAKGNLHLMAEEDFFIKIEFVPRMLHSGKRGVF
jgi:hypothetical protein